MTRSVISQRVGDAFVTVQYHVGQSPTGFNFWSLGTPSTNLIVTFRLGTFLSIHRFLGTSIRGHMQSHHGDSSRSIFIELKRRRQDGPRPAKWHPVKKKIEAVEKLLRRAICHPAHQFALATQKLAFLSFWVLHCACDCNFSLQDPLQR